MEQEWETWGRADSEVAPTDERLPPPLWRPEECELVALLSGEARMPAYPQRVWSGKEGHPSLHRHRQDLGEVAGRGDVQGHLAHCQVQGHLGRCHVQDA